MRPRHNTQIAQALYRVFVCPEPPLLPRHVPRPSCTPPPIIQRRPYAKTRPAVQTSHLLDEQIASRMIRVVDADGKLVDASGKPRPPQSLTDVLRSLDRKKHFLVQVTPPSSDPTFEPPICRVTRKKDFYASEHARQKVQKTPSDLMKQLELNWAIDGNDLGHRLNKMVAFLEEGRRVEVILANKRRGRRATEEDARRVLKEIRGAVEKVQGAREWRVMEGQVLGQCILHFEGKERG